MLPKIDPTKTLAWKKLKDHHLKYHSVTMNELFQADTKRFDTFSFEFEDFLFDFSKNIASEETFKLLIELAKECKLDTAIKTMFEGLHINETESRAVLHTALRSFSDEGISVNGENITPLIQQERKRIQQICQEVHTGSWRGCTGKKIKYIVNIGIGGSDLGASMVTEALRPYWKANLKPFFINSIDASNVCEVVKEIQFDETLFIVASKTFTTQETMTNARTIKRLFLEQFNDEAFIAQHFVAVTK